MKIRIKFPSQGQRNEANPNAAPQSLGHQSSNACFDGKKLKIRIKIPSQGQTNESHSAPQTLSTTCFDGKNTPSGAHKRGPEGVIEGDRPPEKRRKMDPSLTLQCSALLKALMKHPSAAKVFNAKALKITRTMNNPMDLGTIETTLAKNAYVGIEEFAADIKLTFSNAMLHYSANNNVRKATEEINEFFEERLKSLMENWNHQENLKARVEKIVSMRLTDGNGSRKSSKTQLYQNCFLPKKSEPSKKKIVKMPTNEVAVQVELPKVAQNCVSKLARKNLQKDTSSGGLNGGKTQSTGKKTPSAAHKRGPEEVIEGGSPLEKRRKMDPSLTLQCSALLKTLMKHPVVGRVFNAKTLKISETMEKTMDLGTIESKLAKNAYVSIDEFAAEIKFSFSNAMLHFSANNNFHKMAEEFNEFFEGRLKSLEENWNQEDLKARDEKTVSVQLTDVNGSRKNFKTQLYRNSLLPKKSKPSKSREKVEKVPMNEVEVKPPKAAQSRVDVNKLARKNLQKDTSSGSISRQRAHGSINARRPLSQGPCGSIKCQHSIPSDSIHTSSRAATSERSLVGDPRVCSADGTSKLDNQAKRKLTSQKGKSNPDSHEAVSALDKNKVCHCVSHLATSTIDAASGEELLPAPKCDVQMSPKKALRVAMLKSRFSDTILKAQQKMQLVQADKADLVKIQQEKEKLERRRQEEKAKIEDQIRAKEAASKMKEEIELKRQREATRISLQKMENTAGIELNFEIQKELEILSGCSLSLGNPLHKLGLFIKDEYVEDEEDEAVLTEDVEVAEIEARIRPTEATSKTRAEVQLKEQREAARIALQNMANTAGIELNLEIRKELEILSGCSLSHGNSLHQLGMFIKDEYLEDKQDETVLNGDVEDGEILS